jgi:lipopolysaccharide transport system permease protein
MLAKINFPREALLVSALYEILFGLGIKLIVLIGVLLFLNFPIGLGLLLSIPAMIVLILFGMTIGLMLTPLGMLYTDIGSALMVFLQFWFFVTPVVYPSPQSFPYSLISILNPVSPLLAGIRDLMTKGTLIHPISFAVVGGVTLIGLLAAWLMYRLAMPIIIERMSS